MAELRSRVRLRPLIGWMLSRRKISAALRLQCKVHTQGGADIKHDFHDSPTIFIKKRKEKWSAIKVTWTKIEA